MKKENHLQACFWGRDMLVPRRVFSLKDGSKHIILIFCHAFVCMCSLPLILCPSAVPFPFCQTQRVHSTRKDLSSPRASPGCIGMFINSTPEPPKRSWIRRCSDVEEPLNWRCFGCKTQSSFRKAPVLQDTFGFFFAAFAVGKEPGRLASWEKHSKEATPTSTIPIQVTVQVHHDTPK